jgi:2-iminobutanoate/2-iminopropanoate deaminase
MTRRAVQTTSAPATVASYSQAIDTGAYVFCAGQIGLDPETNEIVEGGVSAQAERALQNLIAVLEAAELTLADVVKTTCFLADINDFAAFNEVYGKYMTTPPPARSTFAVAALPKGARVEIEAIAVRSAD